ncbi:MAG TPA: hypothetical protein VLK22_03410 [Candidatus Udaeobacter sp.]|nr:hypothetical protein [Candidatus Udaeobacter sp.]
MEKINKKERTQKWFPIIFGFGLFLFFALTILFSKKVFAATSPTIITYQGKLLISGRLATTTQSMQFTLYDSLSGGTALYTASGTLGTPQSINITPSQGLFSINLGDTGTNSLTPAIFQNNGSVFLEVKVGSDILTPRKQITAVPYAFNAAYLDGVGVNTISSTTYVPKSDSSGNFTFNSTTVNTSTISNLTTTNATSTNFFSSGLTFTNANGTSVTSTNLFASLFAFTTASGASITSTNAFFTNLATTNFSPANITATNVTSTNLFSTNLAFTNASGTSVTTTNLNVTGALTLPNNSITDAMVVDTITASNYLLLTGGTLSGQLNFTSASGTMVTSTNLVTTNATSTNLFSSGLSFTNANGTSVTSTNLFASLFAFTTASGGSITSTNAFFTNLAATNFSPTNLTATSITSTNLNVSGPLTFNTASGTMVTSTNLVTTNASSTNLFSSGLSFTNANGTSITSTNIFTSLFAFTNATGTSVTTTNLNVTGALTLPNNSITDAMVVDTITASNYLLLTGGTLSGQLNFTTASGTMVTSTNLVTTNATSTNLFASLFGFTNANGTSITTTNSNVSSLLSFVSANGTSITSTNIFASLFGFTNSNGTSITSTNGFFTNLAATNFSPTNLTATSITSTNLNVSGPFTFNTASGTSVTTTNLNVTGSNNLITTGSAGQFPYYAANGFSLSPTSTLFILPNRLIGIGTTTPQSKLTIQGDGTANPFSIVSSTAAGTSMLSVLTNGNVGINTSSPIDTFAVQGGVQIVGSVTTTGQIVAYGAPNTSAFLKDDTFGCGFQDNGSATCVFNAFGYLGGTSQVRSLRIDNGNGGTIATFAGATLATALNGALTTVGKVGIGTTTLNNTLTVQGDGTANPFSILSSTPGSASMFTVLTNGRVGINSSSPIASLGIQDTLGVNPFTISSSTSAVSVFTVLSSGNVGINISSPTATLQVRRATSSLGDAIKLYKDSDADQSWLSWAQGAESSASWRLGYTGTPYDLRLNVGSAGSLGAEVMRWAINGRVGLNTTSPIASLSVLASTTNGGSPILEIASSSGASFLRVLANGNIGINSSTPSTRLAVQGTSYFSQTSTFGGNISNIIDSNTVISQIATTSIGTFPLAVFVSGRYAYAANTISNSFSIIDVSKPSSPVKISTTSVGAGSSPQSIFVSGRYAYFGEALSHKLSIFDVSNPAAPVEMSSTTLPGARALYVSGHYVYLVGDTSNSLLVVDVSNPKFPVQVASTSVGTTPISIFVSGRYAYIGNGNSNSLSVVDVSNPAAPVQVATTSVDVGPASIYVSGRYAYLVGGDLFSVVDVSNPAAPVQVATTSMGSGSSPTSVYVSGRYAYLSVANNNTVAVVDVSNPAAPVQVATATVGLSPTSIYVSGRYAYTVNDGDNTFSVVDISGTEVTSLIAHSAEVGNLQSRNDIFAQGNIMAGTSLTVGTGGIFSNGALSVYASSTGSTSSIFDISSAQTPSILKVLANGNIGIGTSTPTEKLSVVGNISNVIGPSTAISQVATTTVGGQPASVFVSGRYAYTANQASNTISIVDISNPLVPVQVGTTSVISSPNSIYVSGRYAYVTVNTGLSVIDISNPVAPKQVATSSFGSSPTSIYVSGRYAYVTNGGDATISIIDVSNPLLPKQVSAVSVASPPFVTTPESIFVSGRYAYVVDFSFSNSISVVDVSDPLSPVRVASTSVGGTPVGIYVSGRYAYVTNFSSNTISVVDVSNPSAPVQVATTSVGGGPAGIYVSGRYAYVTNFSSNTISVVDVSVPSNPRQLMLVNVGPSPVGIYVSGRYAYVANGGSNTISIVDISGTEVTSLIAHSAEVGNLQSRNDIFAQGNIIAGTGLMVGAGGIMSNGALSIFVSSTRSTSSIFDVSSAASTSTSILKIFANGKVAIGTSTATERLSVVGNISNVIDTGTTITQIATTSVGTTPTFIFVSGRYAYISNSDSSSISIVDVSNPFAPVQIATTSVGSAPSSIFVSGRYAYVANFNSFNISVVDVSNPFAPKQVATTSANGTVSPISIFVSGRYAYVSNGDTGNGFINIFDVSNPLAPVKISTTSVGFGPKSIYVSGHYAYTANFSSNTISVVDVSNPSAPVQTATTSVGGAPNSIYVSGRYAYVVNQTSNTISVVDVSNPSAPIQVATTSVGATPSGIFVSGRYAYVNNAIGNTISVVDVSNPSAPIQVATTSVGTTPVSVFVSGRYAYVANQGVSTISVVDISGTEVTSLIAHSAEVGNIQSRNDIFAQGNIMAGTGLMVGAGGIMSQGSLSVFASSTGSTSSIFSIDSAQRSNIFKVMASGTVQVGTSTLSAVVNNYKLFVDAGATSSAGIGVNGFIKASGFISGTTTLDLAELYPLDPNCAQNGNCPQAGDVVCSVDNGQGGFYVAKCSSAYAENSLGIISSDPGFTLGGQDQEGNYFKPVALAGRVPVKISNANGDIHYGDRLAASDVPGVAMKATDEGKTVAMALGDYTSSEVGEVVSFVSVGWNNNLYKGLSVDVDGKNITVGTSTNPYNLVITGNLSLNNPDLINKLSFATSSLFESSVGNFVGARAFTFNAPNFSDTSADSYLISLRSNNVPVFSVAANGDVRTKGSYYGSNIVLGTSTNPGDLAERVDIAVDDTVESGDVMVIDQNSPDTYRRSRLAYEQSVAGVISSNPTIIVGNGKTDYTAVMAMVGRVPVKVSNVNGDIKKGDLLITASTTGFAMKYDPAKDNNNKMVAVIGVALESLSTSTGKVLALIRTGWIYNRDQAIGSLQNNIKQIAVAEGIDLDAASEPDNLNVRSSGSQLAFVNGQFNLQGNSIINVASIIGKDNKWRIDEWGNLIQKIATDKGDKEIYGLQSSDKQEIVISGTSTLENGIKKVILTDLDQAIIDKTVPLKVQITMSGETKGVYVSERSFDSFVVKENDNGQGSASFDWTVIAKLLTPEDSTGSSGDQQSSGSSGSGNDVVSSTISVTTTVNVSSSTSVQNDNQSAGSVSESGVENNSVSNINANSASSAQTSDPNQTQTSQEGVNTNNSAASTP